MNAVTNISHGRLRPGTLPAGESFRSQLETRLNSSVKSYHLSQSERPGALERLSSAEETLLAGCEATIKKGLEGFLEVGTALAMVRESRLYREKFKTFNEYLDVRWGLSPRRALQLRDAAAVVVNLREANDLQQLGAEAAGQPRALSRGQPSLPLPTTESQARVLAGVPKAEQPKVWKAAVEKAAPDRPTARVVQGVIDESANRRVGASAILKPEPRVEQKATKGTKAWPKPDQYGFYSETGAEEVGYVGTKVRAIISLLQINECDWVSALSVGYQCGNMHSFGVSLTGKDVFPSREEALRSSAQELEKDCFQIIKQTSSCVNATQRESARRMRVWAMNLVSNPGSKLKPEPQAKPEAAPKPQNKIERLIEGTQRATKAVSVLQAMFDRTDTTSRGITTRTLNLLDELEKRFEKKARKK